jgi:hypothetical protein
MTSMSNNMKVMTYGKRLEDCRGRGRSQGWLFRWLGFQVSLPLVLR